MKKQAAIVAYYFNKWTDSIFFIFPHLMFSLSSYPFFLLHRLQTNTFPFTQQKINILTESVPLRLATVIYLKD